jgi:trimethylamine--corrinoid protein Co-methyltransferase
LAGGTDAKTLDAQAGVDSTFSILAQALAGLNLIHDVGYLDMGMACSLEMLVLGDEVIGMARRFVRGIQVDAGTLARGEIERVGPGGHYLDTDHTYERFRDELWVPSLLTRQDYTTWKEQGAKDMTARLRERIREILDTHQVDPLPEDVLAALEEIKQRRMEEIGAE